MDCAAGKETEAEEEEYNDHATAFKNHKDNEGTCEP